MEKDPVGRAAVFYYQGRRSKPSTTIKLSHPWMEIYDLRSKTIAVLVRGNDYRLMASDSGWGRILYQPCPLDGEYWSKLAMTSGHTIGHRSTEDLAKDQGKPGKAAASTQRSKRRPSTATNPEHGKMITHASAQPCPDCRAYFNRLRRELSLEFTLMVNGRQTMYL